MVATDDVMMTDQTQTGSERRTASRHRVFIPIRVDGRRDAQVGKVTSAVTRDVSESGLLIRTRRQFTVGAPVTIAVQTESDPQPRELSGSIVRIAANTADPTGLWPFEVAVRLDYPDAALQAHAVAHGFVDNG